MITNYSRYLLLINGAVLLGCAVFDFALRETVLIALLFFLPFTDRAWLLLQYKTYKYQWHITISAIAIFAFILLMNSEYLNFIVITILLVALPEEWFFRAYYLQRLELLCANKWVANIISSSLFAILHVPVQGVIGLTVFIPSLIFGWLYQESRDLILVILVHALSNTVYLIYLKDII